MEQLRHVGYIPSIEEQRYFSPANIKIIGDKAAMAFKNVNIIFEFDVVKGLLEKNYYDYKPPQSDIFACYQIQPFTDQDRFVRAS